MKSIPRSSASIGGREAETIAVHIVFPGEFVQKIKKLI